MCAYIKIHKVHLFFYHSSHNLNNILQKKFNKKLNY